MNTSNRPNKISKIFKYFMMLVITLLLFVLVGGLVEVGVQMLVAKEVYPIYPNYPIKYIVLNLLVCLGLLYWIMQLMGYEKSTFFSFMYMGLFISILIYPISFQVVPSNITDNYRTNYKQISEHEYESGYCSNKCYDLSLMNRKGYNDRDSYYSWKNAVLYDHSTLNLSCCYDKKPFDSRYFFTILAALEKSFIHLPMIVIFSAIVSLFHFRKGEDVKYDLGQLLKEDGLAPKKWTGYPVSLNRFSNSLGVM